MELASLGKRIGQFGGVGIIIATHIGLIQYAIDMILYSVFGIGVIFAELIAQILQKAGVIVGRL